MSKQRCASCNVQFFALRNDKRSFTICAFCNSTCCPSCLQDPATKPAMGGPFCHYCKDPICKKCIKELVTKTIDAAYDVEWDPEKTILTHDEDDWILRSSSEVTILRNKITCSECKEKNI